MCFIGKNVRPKICRKDIPVWKVMCSGTPDRTPYQYFKYENNKLYKTEFGISKPTLAYGKYQACDGIALNYYNNFTSDWKDKEAIDKLILIGEGFHSYATKKRAFYNLEGDILTEFVIPKGSEYYKDNTGVYVSNQIIMKNH